MEISEEIKDQMAAAYNNNVSLRKLAVQFGINIKACREILREKNVAVFPSNGTGSRKYTSSNDFFNIISQEEQAYWLGFLSADGHIAGNSIVVVLKSRDSKHLEKFAKAVETTAPVTYPWQATRGTLRQYVRIQVSSEGLVLGLRELGVKPRKTKTIEPCPNIVCQSELEAAYWRGWVDGDGWISYYLPEDTYKGICAIGFVGNEAVVKGFRYFIAQTLGHINSMHFTPKNSCYNVTYSGTTAKKVAQLLYGNATVYLDRKMEKARKMIASLDEV